MVERACPEVGVDRAAAQTIRRSSQRTRTAQRAAGRRQRPDRVGERAHSERAASPQSDGCTVSQSIRCPEVQRTAGNIHRRRGRRAVERSRAAGLVERACPEVSVDRAATQRVGRSVYGSARNRRAVRSGESTEAGCRGDVESAATSQRKIAGAARGRDRAGRGSPRARIQGHRGGIEHRARVALIARCCDVAAERRRSRGARARSAYVT